MVEKRLGPIESTERCTSRSPMAGSLVVADLQQRDSYRKSNLERDRGVARGFRATFRQYVLFIGLGAAN
jgi:hypothetical protein